MSAVADKNDADKEVVVTDETQTEPETSSDTNDDRRHAHSWLQAPRRVVLVYALAFIVAELVGAFVNLKIQALLDAVFAFIAMNHAVFGYRIKRTAGLVMSALFTTRLMVITLPFTGVSLPTRTAMIAAATILVAYIATYVLNQDVSHGRSDEGFPLKKPFISRNITSLITVLSGIPIGYAAYEILKPGALVIHPLWSSRSTAWMVAGGALALGALAEELLYRRMVAAMVQHTGQSQTPLISGALYGAAYLGTREPLFIALAVVTGAFFAWSCERTGSIKSAVLAHAVISILVFIILPS